MSSDSREHVAKQPWEFDESVAQCMDDMLVRSVPGFGRASEKISDIIEHVSARHPRGLRVLDVGCATGAGLEICEEVVTGPLTYYGIDSSPAMITRARQKFLGEAIRVRRRFLVHDVAIGPSFVDMDISHINLVLAVLTLQFIDPQALRQKTLERIRSAMEPGGVAIVVEKLDPGPLWREDGMIRSMHHAFKLGSYTKEQIAEKERSIAGVLQPWTLERNFSACQAAGFKNPHVFWADTCFAGWVMFA